VSAKRYSSAWTRLSGKGRLIAPGTRISPPRDSQAGRLLLPNPKHSCVAPNPRAFHSADAAFSIRCAVAQLCFSVLSPQFLFVSFLYPFSSLLAICLKAVDCAWLCGNGPFSDPPLSLVLSSYSRCQLMQRRNPPPAPPTLNVGFSRSYNRQRSPTNRSSARIENDTYTRNRLFPFVY
jgi:hypothetical protein